MPPRAAVPTYANIALPPAAANEGCSDASSKTGSRGYSCLSPVDAASMYVLGYDISTSTCECSNPPSDEPNPLPIRVNPHNGVVYRISVKVRIPAIQSHRVFGDKPFRIGVKISRTHIVNAAALIHHSKLSDIGKWLRLHFEFAFHNAVGRIGVFVNDLLVHVGNSHRVSVAVEVVAIELVGARVHPREKPLSVYEIFEDISAVSVFLDKQVA